MITSMIIWPKPTRKNSIAVSIYTLIISVIVFILSKFFYYNTHTENQNMLNTMDTTSLASIGIASAIIICLFFVGLAMLAVYVFFVHHKHSLKIPQITFLKVYFVFISWLGCFVSSNLLLLLTSQIITTTISKNMAMVLNISIITVNNIWALLLFCHYTKIKNEHWLQWLKKIIIGNKIYTIKQLVLWGICAYIAIYPLMLLVVGANSIILKFFGKTFPVQTIVEFSIKNNNTAITILLFVSVTMLAPFFEEIILRGLVFRGLTLKMSYATAGAISGLIFALFHFNILSFLPIAFLGAMFAWVYSRTGSLIPSIVMHGMFNFVNFTLLDMLK